MGVRAADGHELASHEVVNGRYAYVDIASRRALVCTQKLGEAPSASQIVVERAPTPAEQAHIYMSSRMGDMGRVYDGMKQLGGVATDLSSQRDGKQVSACVTNNFDIPVTERRVYVFDTSDIYKSTRLPLIGVYDLT